MDVINALAVIELTLEFKEHFGERFAAYLMQHPVIFRVLNRPYETSHMSKSFLLYRCVPG